MSGVSRYPDGDTFEQRANILIGSNDATLDIYTIRVYNKALSRREIVTNWIADMRDPVVKATYYQDNDNFDETGKIAIEKIPSRTPYMVLQGPELPSYKKDKKILDVKFVHPEDSRENKRSFTASGVSADVQGTSSQYYYRKNFKLNFKEGFYDNYGDWSEKYKHIPPLSKKEKKYTFKTDVASSEGANNVELVRYFEFTKHWDMPSERDQDPDDTADGYLTRDRIRTGIDGFPMIMFHNSIDTNDKNAVFYGKMNFNNDKDNKSTFGFTEGDECWEFINNTTPLVLFQSDDLSNWDISFESRYPEEYGDDDHAYGTQPGELDKLQALMTWVVSTWRKPTDSDAEKARKLNKFKSEFERYFNLKSSLFYYLYTELFLMVDSRAKNAMLAYLHQHKPGDGGNRWFWLPYDMDTAIGTNNEGLLVFDYDAEDTDIINGANVYNGQLSVFWNNLRDAFKDELRQLYLELRSGAAGGDMAWSYANIEKLFEDHQACWSASIFNEDSYFKYIMPLIDPNSNDATYLGMAQGSKEEQRKWWLWNRFRYLDSKYRTGDAQGQYIMIRAYRKASLDVTPYINCYLTAVFDQTNPNSMVTVDAQKDKAYTITPPESWDPLGSDAVFSLYSADLLKDIGDVSALKPGFADFSRATKLQKLKIGSSAPGYTNDKLEILNVGNNHLLTELDATNCSGLGTGDTKVIDLSNCTSIEKAYFGNTNILGVSFPVGGNLKDVILPASITDLTIRNHPNLESLTLQGTNNLTAVWLEDIPSNVINAVDIISAMKEHSSVRLININETINSLETLENFYARLDTMTGKDSKGDTTEKAVVTGVIHLTDEVEISYSDWVRLSNMFDEVTIEARNIICRVTFWDDINETSAVATRNVIYGNAAQAPANPVKPSTPEFYYEFAGWDTTFDNVISDMDIHATYTEFRQRYEVIYDTRSQIIPVVPTSVWRFYGETINKTDIDAPYLNEDDFPEGVKFIDWILPNGNVFVFGSTRITGPTVLSAKWQDENFPVITLTRTSYNSFTYHVEDNMGVSAWLVTQSPETPEIDSVEWHHITPTKVLEDVYTVSAPGHYYFWAKDDQDNCSVSQITAYTISLTQNIHNEMDTDADVIQLALTEGDTPLNYNFAFTGTTITVGLTVSSKYNANTLFISYNNTPIRLGDTLIVDDSVVLAAEVYPNVYNVTFVSERGTTPSPQQVVYKHKILEPDPQTDYGYVLDHWEAGGIYWNFDSDLVLGNITLTAKWVSYSAPTQISVDTFDSNTDITVNIVQDLPIPATGSVDDVVGVMIEWSDGTANTYVTGNGNKSITHTYVLPGPHMIKIYRQAGNYLLGQGISTPAIQPIDLVSEAIFAFDVPYTNDGAFKGAVNLSTIRLTKFMTSIAVSAFEGCSEAYGFAGGSYIIPSSIKKIYSGAFRGCSKLQRVQLPEHLDVLDNAAFDSCTMLETVEFNPNCPLTSLSSYLFNNCVGLTTIDIPQSITTINEAAFAGCIALRSIYLGTNVTRLGKNVFNGCLSLEDITLAAPEMQMDVYIFQSCPLLTSAGPLSDTAHLSDYNIKFGWLTGVPDNAFTVSINSASQLLYIKLPEINTFTTLGYQAFYHCANLSSIVIPSNITTIGDSCFGYCISLPRVEIPSTVESMGSSVFYYCSGLRYADIYMSSSTTKADIPDAGWFRQTRYPQSVDDQNCLKIRIPRSVSPEDAGIVYGDYWNCHSYSGADILYFDFECVL